MKHHFNNLSHDDLALLGNKGNLKRALRELTQQTTTLLDFEETTNALRFVWSDEVTCTIRSDEPIQDTQCTCPSSKVCRHLLRSILYLQSITPPTESTITDTEQIWRPGQISEETLAKCLDKKTIKDAQSLLNRGIIAETQLARRPSVRFHRLGYVVKFVVPLEPNFAKCTCTKTQLCVHVALAILADKQANKDESHGFVSTIKPKTLPTTVMDRVDAHLFHVIKQGVTGLQPITKSRLLRLIETLKQEDMIWPAEILTNLHASYDAYDTHDAQFTPTDLTTNIGQWLIRRRALLQEHPPSPRWFIHGEANTSNTKLTRTHLIGLGSEANIVDEELIIHTYFYDQSTGSVRRMVQREPKDIKLSTLTNSTPNTTKLVTQHLIVEKAQLNASNELDLSRAQLGVYAQDFQWDNLDGPLYQESFKQLHARIKGLPVASLRAKNTAEHIAVVPIARIENAQFNERLQRVEATLFDAQDHTARLQFNYQNFNRLGTEYLLKILQDTSAPIQYICGQVQLEQGIVCINPLGLVTNQDQTQQMIQPWLTHVNTQSADTTIQRQARKNVQDPLAQYQHQLGMALGQFYLLGLDHLDANAHETWSILWENVQSLGLTSIFEGIKSIRDMLEPNATTPQHAQLKTILDVTLVHQLINERM